MGVYINMEMPTSCDNCWALDDYGDYPRCRITDEQRGYNFRVREKRMDKCPLVSIPPHGRLIDADALKERVTKRLYSSNHGSMAEAYYAALIDLIDTAPTIIPEEEGE